MKPRGKMVMGLMAVWAVVILFTAFILWHTAYFRSILALLAIGAITSLVLVIRLSRRPKDSELTA